MEGIHAVVELNWDTKLADNLEHYSLAVEAAFPGAVLVGVH